MTKSLIAGMLLLSCLLVAAQAHPCSCVSASGSDAQQIAAALRSASAVFLGRITSSEMESWREAIPLTEIRKTKFKILKQWKGAKADDLEFRVDVQCCVCGYEFPPKGEFLVYAYGPTADGYYTTSTCTRTRHASEAGKDIEVLDSLVGDAAAIDPLSDTTAGVDSGSEGENLPNKALQPTCEDARG